MTPAKHERDSPFAMRDEAQGCLDALQEKCAQFLRERAGRREAEMRELLGEEKYLAFIALLERHREEDNAIAKGYPRGL